MPVSDIQVLAVSWVRGSSELHLNTLEFLFSSCGHKDNKDMFWMPLVNSKTHLRMQIPPVRWLTCL